MYDAPDAAPRVGKISQGRLDALAARHETDAFLAADPVGIPHAYRAPADREIAAFFAATFAWGQRATVLAKTRDLLARLGESPHAWIVGHAPRDRAAFDDFAHRTFQPADARYFAARLQRHYRRHDSLESLFTPGVHPGDPDVRGALEHFHRAFFDAPEAPARTRKHVATPARGSSCKRLNMLLRWMVRPAARGVDFGLWRGISPAQLVIPLDVHVRRTAIAWGLLTRKQPDWRAAVELTAALRAFDPEDPVRYDFALFGAGVGGEG